MGRFVVFFLFFLSSAGAATSTTSSIPTEKYDVPEYNQAKLPAISSCDPKALGEDADVPSTGNMYFDAAAKTAQKVQRAYATPEEDSDSEKDLADVDGKATLETDCEKLKVDGAADALGIDSEKLGCDVVKDDMEALLTRVAASKKYLACKRGVLDALRGEIGCFKKQIGDAEGYMNELVNGAGGMAEMLNNGNAAIAQIDQEVQDRTSQLAKANERIEGGPGGNPPGLAKAREFLGKLSANMPNEVTRVRQEVENLRNQQSRFNTLVDQLVMGRAMACMKTPTAGFRCVKDGTTSPGHPEWNGNVSPQTYLECLYAQSANKLVGGRAVLNPSREAALLQSASSAFAQASAKAPSATDLPDFSDTKAFSASMKVYPIKTPADMLKALAPTLKAMGSATGKDINGQFVQTFSRCYATAKAEVAKERTDTNSQIKATETAMKQSFEKTRTGANASKFRELRDQYVATVRAATGAPPIGQAPFAVSTEKCEKASLEDQADCMDMLNSMADSLLTGAVVAPSVTFKANSPALSLTNGQTPIHGFTGSLAATGNPARTIPVPCGGIDDCLAKYTNLRTQLTTVVEERKAFKETYKTQINTKLQTTAKELAAKGTTGVGQAGIQPGSVTLNLLAGAVASRKTQLETMMGKFGVDGGLDLDPKEIKDPTVDEKTGLYKPADLKNLVLAEIEPKLPDTNSKGFSETLKAVKTRDDELAASQKALDTDLAAVKAKVAECKKEVKTKNCDRATKALEKCEESGSKDELSRLDADIATITAALSTANAMKNNGEAKNLNTRLAEKNSKKAGISTALICGVKQTEYEKYCDFGDAVTENEDKGDQETGGKQRKRSDSGAAAK